MPRELAVVLFNRDVNSPYMSFAPMFSHEARQHCKEVTHLDGSGRVQTVSAEDNKWLYAVLQAVGRTTGLPVLGNTSFNARGKPMINSASAALKMLHSSHMTHVLLEDWLFSGKS